MWHGRKQFKTKHEAQNLRRFVWICIACHRWHKEQKPRSCPCGSDNFYYCQSDKEATRLGQLLMLQHYEQISELEVHPSFEFIENGIKVFTYNADTRYLNKENVRIIEDVKASKNPKSWDPVFVLKKKLIEARYGIEITIVTGK